jgi:hypothetical protein
MTDCSHCSSRDTLEAGGQYREGRYVVRAYYCSCCARLTLVQKHTANAAGRGADKKTAGDVTSITG